MPQNRNNIEMELILGLLRNSSHLREIARNIDEPLSTVSRKINNLAGEDAVEYRVDGKNKIFYIKDNIKAKNYVYSAEMYKLSKLINKYPELGITLEEVKKIAAKGIMLLFGSYARFNPKAGSDIDLYIETTDEKIIRKIGDVNSKINVKIGKFDTSSLLIKEIIKNHVIIRGAEEFYEKTKFFEEPGRKGEA